MGKVKNLITLGLTGMYILAGSHAAVRAECKNEIKPNFNYTVSDDNERALTDIGNGLPLTKERVNGGNMALFMHMIIGQQKAEYVGRIEEEKITADCFKDLTPYFSNAADKALISEFDEKTVCLYDSTFGSGKHICESKAVELGNGFKTYCQNTKAGYTAGGRYIFKNAAASTLHEWVCKYVGQRISDDSSFKAYIWTIFNQDEFNASGTFVLKDGIDLHKVDCTTTRGALVQLIVEINQMVAEVNSEIYPMLLTDCSGFAIYDFENGVIRAFNTDQKKKII